MTGLCEDGNETPGSLKAINKELHLLAFDIAERNEIPYRFRKEKRITGKKWYYAFMNRHPELNLSQPKSTSFSRAKGFNKENFETDDVPFMEASTIEPVDQEIPEPNRPNTVIPEKGAISSGSQDSLESLPGDAATLAPKLQVSLGEISPIPQKISLGRSTIRLQSHGCGKPRKKPKSKGGSNPSPNAAPEQQPSESAY
ncbi:hypothetical protein ANN_22603 [Periplaneta americana]|uniref:Uncharacterized protein n=1 Tax=Periplaneta americana TaxID=6978 RepID=A0ABQ8S9J4_PERAM|nr:hypothetical protein ANN_22603 [Periplaneta americana]